MVEIIPASKFKTMKAFRRWQAKQLSQKDIPLCKAEIQADRQETPTLFSACVSDKTRLYSAYLLRIYDPQTEWGVNKVQEKEIDELAGLPDIFSEDPGAEDNQALVDELTGKKVKKPKGKKGQGALEKAKNKAARKKPVQKPQKDLSNDEDVLY